MTIEVSAEGSGAPRRRTVAAVAAEDFVVRVPVEGLTPATRYHYQVAAYGERMDGAFTTAPAADEAARVTFQWSGDLGGGGHCRPIGGEYRIFRAMARLPADFFLFVGDTAYADVACNRARHDCRRELRARTLAEFRARHRYNRRIPRCRPTCARRRCTRSGTTTR